MALRALQGEPEHGLAQAVHAVEQTLDAELLGHDGPLLVDHAVAQEAGGDDLVLAGAGQQVAGDLLDDEAVVRQVAVERADHPVAPGPLLARQVLFIAVAVRVTRGVEPDARPLFAVTRAGKLFVDGLRDRRLQAGLRDAALEPGDFLRRRRQAAEIKPEAAGQLRRDGGRRELKTLPGQALLHKKIHRMRVRRRLLSFSLRAFKGPVAGVLGAFGNPALQQVHLRRADRLFLARRRHDFVGIMDEQAGDQRAFRRLAGHDRRAVALAAPESGVAQVQAQAALAGLGVAAVAVVAVLREDGLHLAAEIHGAARARQQAAKQNQRKKTKHGLLAKTPATGAFSRRLHVGSGKRRRAAPAWGRQRAVQEF